jgi:hypothetical protein
LAGAADPRHVVLEPEQDRRARTPDLERDVIATSRALRGCSLVLAVAATVMIGRAVTLPSQSTFVDVIERMRGGDTAILDPTDPVRFQSVIDAPCGPFDDAIAVVGTGRPIGIHGTTKPVRLEIDGDHATFGLEVGPGKWGHHVTIPIVPSDQGCRVRASTVGDSKGAVLGLESGSRRETVVLDSGEGPFSVWYAVHGPRDVEVELQATLHELEAVSLAPAAIRLRRAGIGAAVTAVVVWMLSAAGSTRHDPRSRTSSGHTHRSRRSVRRARFSLRVIADDASTLRIGIVAVVATLCAIMATPHGDDGWVEGRVDLVARGSALLMDPYWRGVVQPQGELFERLLALLVPTQSLILLRAPNVIAVVLVWLLIERIAAGISRPRSAGGMMGLAMAVWLMAIPELVRTYRPEAGVALLLALVLVQHQSTVLHRATLAVSITVPAAAALALHQTGWVVVLAGIPLVLAASRTGVRSDGPRSQPWKLSSVDGTFLASAAGVAASLGIVLMLPTINVDTFRASVSTYNAYFGGRPPIAPLREYERIIAVVESGRVANFALGVGAPIIAGIMGVGAMRGRVAPKKRGLAIAASLSATGLLLTSSKWSHHVIVLAVVVAVAVLIIESDHPAVCEERWCPWTVGPYAATVLLFLASLSMIARTSGLNFQEPGFLWMPRTEFHLAGMARLFLAAGAGTALAPLLRGPVVQAFARHWDRRGGPAVDDDALGRSEQALLRARRAGVALLLLTGTGIAGATLMVVRLHGGWIPSVGDVVMPQRSTVPVAAYLVALYRILSPLLATIGFVVVTLISIGGPQLRIVAGESVAAWSAGRTARAVMTRSAWVAAVLSIAAVFVAPTWSVVAKDSSRSFASALLESESRGVGRCGLFDAADARTEEGETWHPGGAVIESVSPANRLLITCFERPRPVGGRWEVPTFLLDANPPTARWMVAGAPVACLMNPAITDVPGSRLCIYETIGQPARHGAGSTG